MSATVAAVELMATDSAARDHGAPRYAGLVTRLIAFAADAAVINGVALLVGVVVGLALSLFDLSEEARTALVAVGAAIALIWGVSYFVAFWSTTGQTPGDRVMHIQVLEERGRPVSSRRALARLLLLPLSVITLGAGMLLILVSARRRALHDVLATPL